MSELIAPPLHLIRRTARLREREHGQRAKESGRERGRGGGQRQETQGCWHVLFFHYVISIPMRRALIFDEPSAQHPPLSPSHPIPSRPPLSSPSLYFSSRLSSPTYSTGARLLLCASEHLPFLLEPLHLCQSSRGGLESRGVNFSLSHSPRLLFVGSAEILPSARISMPHTRALQRRPSNANEELLKEVQIS